MDFLVRNTSSINEVEGLVKDEILTRACIRSLEIIGEAVKKISPELRNQNPGMEWKSMAGMRDKLIHHYFDVDYELVWDVIKNKIPNLANDLKEILKKQNP